MKNNSEIFKKLCVLKNNIIWLDNDVNLHTLYLTKKIILIEGTVYYNKALINDYNKALTNEYLNHTHEVFTGRPEKSYTNNWATYRKCERNSLLYDGTNIIITIVIRNGDMFNGNPISTRWEGTFKLDVSEIDIFKSDINREFDNEIHRLFLIEEEYRTDQIKQKIKERLLK